MDTFTLFAFKKEVENNILFQRINKIYQNNEIFTFKLSSKKNLIFNFKTIFLSSLKLKNPSNPPTFCMLLRKYIENSIIIEINFFKFYRILEFILKKGEQNYLLHINFSLKNKNLILKKENIIASLFNNSIFPVKEIPLLKLEEFIASINSGKLDGFPPFVINELKFLLKKCNINEVYNKYLDFYNFKINFIPIKIEKKYYPTTLNYLLHKEKVKKFNSFNNLLKYKFEEEFLEKEKNILLKSLNNKIKKIEKTIDNIHREIQDKKNYEKYFKFGELLKANIHLIKKGKLYAEVIDYFDENMPKIRIPLYRDKTPNENIENYFKKAKKGKRGLIKLQQRENELISNLEKLKKQLSFLENCQDLEELIKYIPEKKHITDKKKKQEITIPFKKFSYKNISIVAGKSSKGNEFILKKFGNPDYLWFHVKDYSGSHVIVLEKKENLNNDIIEFAAKIALENSRAKNNGKGEVIFTKIKYLNKPKGAPSGLVTVKEHKTIYVSL